MPSDITPNDILSPSFGDGNILLEWKWGDMNTYDIDNIMCDISEFLNYVKTGDVTWDLFRAWTFQAKEFCSYARPDVHFNQLYDLLYPPFRRLSQNQFWEEILERSVCETLQCVMLFI